MTYGDKYMELWKDYVNKQSEYFAELLPKAKSISSEKLREISEQMESKHDFLVKFAAYMRVHSKDINDLFIAETLPEISN